MRFSSEEVFLAFEGGILTGDAAGVDAEAHGVAGEDEGIAVAEDVAGVGADTVQAGDDLGFLGHDLGLVVDLDAAEGAVGADVLPQAVERALLDGLHVAAILLEDLVVAGVAHVVVLLDLGNQTRDVDAGLLRQLFDGVGLGHGLIAGSQVTVPLLVEVVVQVVRMHVGDDVRAVLLVLLEQLAVEDGEGDGAGLHGDGVAGEGGVSDLVLGHEALAVTVDPQAGLTERAVEDEVVHVVGQLIHQLHRAGLMAGAGFPAHLDAFALHAGDGKVEDGLAELVAGLLLDHLGVVAEAAGGDDDRLGSGFDLFAVLVLGQHADRLAVLHEDLGDGGLELEVDTELAGALGHLLGHGSGRSGAGDAAALRLADVPGELAVRVGAGGLRSGERALHADELHTHVHEPVDGLAGLEVVVADHAGIDTVVSEVHVLAEGLARRQRDHVLSLDARADAQGAHAHVGGAAGGVGLLEAENGRAVFRGGDAGGQAGQTGSDHDDISLHLLHKNLYLRVKLFFVADFSRDLLGRTVPEEGNDVAYDVDRDEHFENGHGVGGPEGRLAQKAYVEPGQDQAVDHDVDQVHNDVDQKAELQRARLSLAGLGEAQTPGNRGDAHADNKGNDICQAEVDGQKLEAEARGLTGGDRQKLRRQGDEQCDGDVHNEGVDHLAFGAHRLHNLTSLFQTAELLCLVLADLFGNGLLELGVGVEAALGLTDLLEVTGAANDGGAVLVVAVLLNDELPLAVGGLFQGAAAAADLALDGIVDAVPLHLAKHQRVGVAVRAPAHVFVAEPGALLGRRGNGLHDVFAHLVCAGNQLVVEQALASAGNAGAEDHVDDLEVGGEHGGLHALKRHGLPGSGGAADGDQAGDAVAVLDGADGFQEGGLKGEASLREGQVLGVRHQIVCRSGVDDGVLVEQHVHDFLLVVLVVEHAARVLALCHAAGAGGAAGAGFDVEVLEVDHAHLSAELLAGHQCFLQKDLAVAVLASGGYAHDFVRHSFSPLILYMISIGYSFRWIPTG